MKTFKQFAALEKIDERVTFVTGYPAKSPEMDKFIEDYRLGNTGDKVSGGDYHVDGGTILDVDRDIIVVGKKAGSYFYISEISIPKKTISFVVFDDPKAMRVLKSLL